MQQVPAPAVAAADTMAKSQQQEVPLLQEGVRMACQCVAAYLLAWLRFRSRLGKLPLHFKSLMVESDTLDFDGIINPKPIPLQPDERKRFRKSMMDIMELMCACFMLDSSDGEKKPKLAGDVKDMLQAFDYLLASSLPTSPPTQEDASFPFPHVKTVINQTSDIVLAQKETAHSHNFQHNPLFAQRVESLFPPDSFAHHGVFEHGSHIVWISDTMSEHELVYFISLNSNRKEVVVAFRGTATLSDIRKDTKFGLFEMKNPISEDYEGKLPSIGMHVGFSDYLFAKRQDTSRSKYDEIADQG